MGIFIGLLIVFKELKRENLSFFIEILKLKSYTESVKKNLQVKTSRDFTNIKDTI